MIMIAPEDHNRHPVDAEISKDESIDVGKVEHIDDDSLSGEEGLSNSAQAAMMMHTSNKQRVMVPGHSDVLLGRGKPFQSHQGNQLMLRLVDQFRTNYVKADRKGKHMIIEQVLRFIKEHGGRFLMRVDYENFWVEVKRSISYRKVGHAFRSKARRSQKEIQSRAMMKFPGSGFLGRPSLEMEMLAMNQARANQMGPSMMGSGPSMMGSGPSMMGSGSSMMGSGSSMMGSGSLIMGSGPSMMGSGPSMMGSGPSMMGSGPSMMGSGSSMMGSASSMMGSGSSMMGSGSSMMGSGPSMMGSGPSMMGSGPSMMGSGPSMMGSGLSSTNPLLRLPSRLPSSNNSMLRQQQQDMMLNDMLAMERVGAQQDALVMRRQFQGGPQPMAAFSNSMNQSNTTRGRFGANSMDELLMLERFQGRTSAQGMNCPNNGGGMFDPRMQGGGGMISNNSGMFNANQGMMNGNQGMFSGNMF